MTETLTESRVAYLTRKKADELRALAQAIGAEGCDAAGTKRDLATAIVERVAEATTFLAPTGGEPDESDPAVQEALSTLNIARRAGLPIPDDAPGEPTSNAEPPEPVEAEVVDETEEQIPAAQRESASAEIAVREPAPPPALIPSAAEFTAIREMAAAVASTQMVPVAYRGKPDDVLAAILTGREMGIGPMQSLRDIYVVDGKPSLAANFLLAMMRRNGVRVLESVSTRERAWIRARRTDTGEVAEVEWTFDDAKAIVSKGKSLVEKDNWRNYPADMLWARAVGRLARRLAPDLIGGAMPYTSEEVQDWDDFADEPKPVVPRGTARGQDGPRGYVPARNAAELRDRLVAVLGAREGPEWAKLAIEARYGAGAKLSTLPAEQANEAGRLLNAVLRDLSENVEGDLAFREDVRNVVAAAFKAHMDVSLAGPPWRLSPNETTIPLHPDDARRIESAPAGAEGAGDTPSRPEASEGESGDEAPPDEAPDGPVSAEDDPAEAGLDGVDF